MLGISRKPGEEVMIGDDIRIIVTKILDGRAYLAIGAPREIPIHRREVYDKIHRNERRDER
jgi:carbon storage regulator